VPDNTPEDDRRGHPIARPVLFMLWTLVFWGTVVAGAIVWRSVEMGPAAVLRVLIVGTPTVPPTLGRFSLACAVVAVAVWTTVAILLVKRRRAAEEDDPWP
jgi:hypothetical protein